MATTQAVPPVAGITFGKVTLVLRVLDAKASVEYYGRRLALAEGGWKRVDSSGESQNE
jgi:hypothetical protein